MKKNRYTFKLLEIDTGKFNERLAKAGSDRRFHAGARKGFSVIEIYSESVRHAGGGSVERHLESGTPQVCYQSMGAKFSEIMDELEIAKLKTEIAFQRTK